MTLQLCRKVGEKLIKRHNVKSCNTLLQPNHLFYGKILPNSQLMRYFFSTSSSNMNINVEVKNGVRHIIINRPEKRNALTRDMFTSIMTSLNDANEDDSTVIVALRGVGDYFTSGMDMTPSKKPNPESDKTNKTDGDGKKNRFREDFVKFHSSFVQCKKPLMALVNGPTIGVGVTMLGLCDNVYCSDTATFKTLFTRFAVPPEMSSTTMFPKIMGYAKASNLLLFNQKMTAQEAFQVGLVSRIFPSESFISETEQLLNTYGQLPVKSLMYSKDLVKNKAWKEEMIKVSEKEQSYFDPEIARKVIMQFMARKMQKS